MVGMTSDEAPLRVKPATVAAVVVAHRLGERLDLKTLISLGLEVDPHQREPPILSNDRPLLLRAPDDTVASRLLAATELEQACKGSSFGRVARYAVFDRRYGRRTRHH